MRICDHPICITGSTCSGKTTMAKYIEQEYGHVLIEHSELARRVIKQKKLPNTWNNIFDSNIDMRKNYGNHYIVKTILNEKNNPKRYVFSGIRTMDELSLLESKGAVSMGILLSRDIDQSIEIGYNLMYQRKRSGDLILKEEFEHGFMREWDDSDPMGFKTKECIAHVEKLGNLIINDSSLEDLYAKINDLLTSV